MNEKAKTYVTSYILDKPSLNPCFTLGCKNHFAEIGFLDTKS